MKENIQTLYYDGLPLISIDLGSNSFHMMVTKLYKKEIITVNVIGEKIELISGLTKEGYLTDKAINRGISCLERFNHYIQTYEIKQVKVIGTSVFRLAKNIYQFINKAKTVFPYPINIVSGEEEARLIYLGIAHTQSNNTNQKLIIDIGGSSTELIIGKNFEPKLLKSLTIGCLTFSDKFFPDRIFTLDRFNSAYYAAKLELLKIKNIFKELNWQEVVGSSGSIGAIMRISAINRGKKSMITRCFLFKLKKELITNKYYYLLRLNPNNYNLFPAGLAILMAAFDVLDINNMKYSKSAIREGVIYDLLGRNSYENIRERTIQGLMNRHNVEIKRAENRVKHVTHCFKLLSEKLQLSDEDYLLLKWTCQICEIGMNISYRKYSYHSYYLIQHAELFGFSINEQQQLALLVMAHKLYIPKKLYSKNFTFLCLLIILRISVILGNMALSTFSLNYNLKYDNKKFILEASSQWFKQHPLTIKILEEETLELKKIGFLLELVESV